jgi:hypothetical protein
MRIFKLYRCTPAPPKKSRHKTTRIGLYKSAAIVARGNEFEVTDAGEVAVTNGCERDWKKHLKNKNGAWLSH